MCVDKIKDHKCIADRSGYRSASPKGPMARRRSFWHVDTPVMKARLGHARRPNVLAIVLLAALVFRAYVPVGFMPASGAPFLVELCPAYAGSVLPAHQGHHHHSQSQADFQDCPFGSTPALGPVSHLVAFEPAGQTNSFVAIPAEPGRLSTRLLRAHQPRGPPSLA
jgi:hypothetical protein